MKKRGIIVAVGITILATQFATAQRANGMGRGERPSPQEIFQKIDTNNDGRISKKELADAPRPPRRGGEQRGEQQREFNQEQRDQHFNRIDENGDGYITLQEFKAGAPKGRGGQRGGKMGNEREKQRGDREFENGKRGKQQGNQMHKRAKKAKTDAIETMSWKTAKATFKQADDNNDKQLNYAEFVDVYGGKVAFARIDTNDNGFVTKKELKKALK